MLSRVLVLLVLSAAIRPYEIREYRCDSRQKVQEVTGVRQHFRRLLRHGDQLYLVFQHRVIFGRLPSADDQLNDRATLVSYRWSEQELQQSAIEKKIAQNDSELLGQFYGEPHADNIELFSNRSTGRLQAYALSFADAAARRPIDARTEIGRILSAGQLDRMFELLEDNRTRYVDALYDRQGWLLVSRLTRDSETNLQIELITQQLRNELRPVYHSNTWPFLTYTRGPFDNIVHVQFVGLDQTNFRLNFGHYFVRLQETSTDFRLVRGYTAAVELHELLGCPVKLADQRELKGIYYNRTFFIFINRFYLRVTEDDLLSASGFGLKDSFYESNAHQLKLESEGFEHTSRRWVHAVGKRTFFKSHNESYELSVDESGGLAIRRTDGDPVGRCFWQIFVVNERTYCFTQTDYFLMNANRTDHEHVGTIRSIFSNSKISLEGHRLWLIFSYRQGQADQMVVFMSQARLFFFEYRRFKRSNKRLAYLHDPSSRVPTVENCLLANCDRSLNTGKRNIVTKQPKTTKTSSAAGSTVPMGRILGLSLLSAGLGLLLLILCCLLIDCWCKSRRKHSGRRTKSGRTRFSRFGRLRSALSRSERLPRKKARPVLESGPIPTETLTWPELKLDLKPKTIGRGGLEKSKKVLKTSKSLKSLKKETPAITTSLLSKLKTKIPTTTAPSVKTAKGKFKSIALKLMAQPKRATFTVIRASPSPAPRRAHSMESKRSVMSMADRTQSDSVESDIGIPLKRSSSDLTVSSTPSILQALKQEAAKGSAISFKDPADTSSLLSYELVEASHEPKILPEHNKESTTSDSSKGKKKKA